MMAASTANRRPPMLPAQAGERAARLLAGGPAEMRLSKAERVERAERDFTFFCRYYLPNYFSLPPAPFHQELSDLIDQQERVMCAAPREHAKSTIVSFAKPLQAICCDLAKFIVILRDTDPIGAQNVDEIRQELESNERILDDFGDLVGKRKWTESEFITKNGIKVFARGGKSSARGLRFQQYRPDLVVADDLEDDQTVDSREQRDKLERRLLRTWIPTIAPRGRFFMIGTVLHHDSVLRRFLQRTDVFVTRLYRAETAGRPLWPERWPVERLAARRKEIGERAYATEYLNDPANEEDQIFRREMFRRFEDDDIAGVKMDVVIAVDPAIGQKQKNDDTGLVVAGQAEGRIYVLRMRLKKLKIQQQVDLILATVREFPRVLKVGFETVAYQAGLKQLVEDASKRANLQIPCVAVEDISSDKIRRISTLAPLAEQGLLYFPDPKSSYWSPDVEKCIEQFEALGVSMNSHDDGPDAVERACKLLRGGSARKGSVRLV